MLEWFRNSSYEFKYSIYPIEHASKNGHISVLERFQNSDFEFKYTNLAIDYASINGYIRI